MTTGSTRSNDVDAIAQDVVFRLVPDDEGVDTWAELGECTAAGDHEVPFWSNACIHCGAEFADEEEEEK